MAARLREGTLQPCDNRATITVWTRAMFAKVVHVDLASPLGWDLRSRPGRTVKTLTVCVAIGFLCDGCCLFCSFMLVRTSLDICYATTVC